MRINEVEIRKIGVPFDEAKAKSELAELYGSFSLEELEKMISSKKSTVQEVQSLLGKIKTTYSLHEPTYNEAIKGLTRLLMNMYEGEYKALNDLRRKKRRRL